MKPTNTDEILAVLRAAFTSAALGTAFELGLFWLLDQEPLSAAGVAEVLGIPGNRCWYWLQLLEDTGLIRETAQGYVPSPTARKSILETYSRDTWAFLAQEAREISPVLRDLALHIRVPGSVMGVLGFEPRNYVLAMREDPARARRFTRMLYELHQPLAEQLAEALDMRGVQRFMDLGGGSGVVSLALLNRHPNCQAVVIDIENVCLAGSEIAAKTPVAGRITYQPVDLFEGQLPAGFDMVLECDVGEYQGELFGRIQGALNPGGRLVIVDQFPPAVGVARPGQLHWAFERSLRDPRFRFLTAGEVRERLVSAGFEIRSEITLGAAASGNATFDKGHTVIEARLVA
jgi:predicted transcriptional regulator/predicted O-methyltransferase YrrM